MRTTTSAAKLRYSFDTTLPRRPTQSEIKRSKQLLLIKNKLNKLNKNECISIILPKQLKISVKYSIIKKNPKNPLKTP